MHAVVGEHAFLRAREYLEFAREHSESESSVFAGAYFLPRRSRGGVDESMNISRGSAAGFYGQYVINSREQILRETRKRGRKKKRRKKTKGRDFTFAESRVLFVARVARNF